MSLAKAVGVNPVEEKFNQAFAALIEQTKLDRSILAAMLCGSLSHDTVWAKSDIDLILVTIDEKQLHESGVALYADGVNVHAMLIRRTDFRRIVEGTTRNSFMHSLLAKGRLIYTHDHTIAELVAGLQQIGGRDSQIQLLRAATGALACIYKAHKWLITRGDLEYTALWILYAATALAEIEVVDARILAEREVIQQAMKLNPTFFTAIYTDLLNTRKTEANVRSALQLVDDYLSKRAARLFAPVIAHLRDVAETRSATEIENFFKRNYDIESVTTACEYLADQGLIGKASTPVRLTKKSNLEVQELAFYSLS